jgi:hypothetical protein
MKIYKVLTLWEPWATLFAHGIKKLETRPKATNFRGTYLIHSALKWDAENKNIWQVQPFYDELISLWNKTNYPFLQSWLASNRGHIIGAVDVVDCQRILSDWEESGYMYQFEKGLKDISPTEEAFGDYRDGRYVWICENHRVLETPIPYKGQQGYYHNFNGDVDQLIFKDE